MSFSKKLARFALSGALAMSMVLPNSLAVFQAKVNADSLYLRQSPGGAVITTLSKGTTVAVLNNSSSWYKVSVNGKEGYVSGEYLTGTTATNVALGTGTVKCSSSVNFRSAPNTSSTSYGELKNGTKVNVVGVSSGWYKVTYNGKTGYIHPDYITLASSSAGTAIAPSNTVTSTTGHRRYGEVFLECKPAFRGQYFLFHSGRAEERHRSYRCQHRERLVQGNPLRQDRLHQAGLCIDHRFGIQ